MKSKRILTIVIVIALLANTLTYAAPSSWAEGFMKSMLLEGLVSEEMLDPDKLQQPITREEFAELTVRLYAKAEGEEIGNLIEWNPFADSDNKMVSKAYNIGIVSGTGTDSRDRKLFTPNRLVTRQEMAVMMVKELKILGVSVNPQYNKKFSDDSDIASWAYDAMAYTVESNIFSGVGGDRVAPKENATREQAMVIINKIAFQYGWIEEDLTKSMFSYSNASKSGSFWLPNDHELRAVKTSTGVKYSISHLVDSYTIDIKGQQKAMINILANSEVSYNGLKVLKEKITDGYDPIAKIYNTQSLQYINLTTGAVSSKAIAKPYIKFKVDGEITVEYVK